ncbi:hypothetical protein EDD85DRAFT_163767 [Armillaria nabsnona]|nr:hypothetical protein EDD85DRAFT_163767 [Armillaria nabsnona]
MLLSYLCLSALICIHCLPSFALQLSITGQAAINGVVTLVWERGGGDPLSFFLRSVKTDKSPSTISEPLDIGDISGDANTVQIPFNQTGTFEFQAFVERNQTTGFFSKSNSFKVATVASITPTTGDDAASTSPQDVGQTSSTTTVMNPTSSSFISTTIHEVAESSTTSHSISTESMLSEPLISSITLTVTAEPTDRTRQSSKATEHTFHTGVIIGATISGVFVLVVALLSICYCVRRHRTSTTFSEGHDIIEQFPYVPQMSLRNHEIGLEGGERDCDPRREQNNIRPPIASPIHPAPQSPTAAKSSLLSPPPISSNPPVSNSPQMNPDDEATTGSLGLGVQMEELALNPEWSTMGPPPPYVSGAM